MTSPKKTWHRRLRRMRRMDAAELLGRALQKGSLWLDRIRAPEGRSRALREFVSGPGGEALLPGTLPEDALRELRHRFERMAPSRFFEGSTGTPELKRSDRTSIRSSADRICAGRFDLLGYSGMSFGEPIDWHLDPVSGRRAPFVHWSGIDFLDPQVVGDSKVVWELNRHQWMVRLGQAYRLTGEELYARLFATHLRDWFRANPEGIGINWTSSLEASLRLISWCWCLVLFRESPALDTALFLQILDGIAAHAAHVERYLSHYFSPNTHLTGEALGLFYAGVLFSDLRSAARWRAKSEKILVEQIERQVLPDGVYFEQSTCYERYTIEIYLHFLILAKRNGIAVPEIVGEKLQRMLEFLLAVRRPDGSMPAIGDGDGGWLMPLAPRTPGDLRGVFGMAAGFFGRADFAWAAGSPVPEAEWLLGAAERRALESLRPAPPAGSPSRVFANGGYAVLRDSFEERAHHLIFDVGPLGGPRSSGHGHADLLSVQLTAFGEPYVVDPGTFGYTADADLRKYFRGSAAHSTIRVDEAEQADPDGVFGWSTLPQARLRLFLSTGSVELAEAEHHAYCREGKGALHRRRVLFVRRSYWVLVDDVEGSGTHGIELRFQFAPLPVVLDSSLWARAQGRRGQALFVRSFATGPLEGEIREGWREPMDGWVSEDYGRIQPAPLLLYRTRAPLPVRLVTLLIPVEDPMMVPPFVATILDERKWPIGLIFGDGERVLFQGSVLRAESREGPRELDEQAAPERVVSTFPK